MKPWTSRQGDVLIEQIATIPETAKAQPASKSIILAHGEVTGHHHVLQAEDPADWWKEGEIPTTLDKPAALIGEIFVSAPKGAVITHDEHGTIPVPPGNYRISRQREYHPEAIRNVAD